DALGRTADLELISQHLVARRDKVNSTRTGLPRQILMGIVKTRRDRILVNAHLLPHSPGNGIDTETLPDRPYHGRNGPLRQALDRRLRRQWAKQQQRQADFLSHHMRRAHRYLDDTPLTAPNRHGPYPQ